MPPTPSDLLITAGRIYCPATGLDGPGAVAVNGSRISAAGPTVLGTARQRLDFPDALLMPGLVDLHAHPDRGCSKYGIDPDVHILPRGVTTVLSQGDAGANDWPAYRDGLIRTAQTRVRLAINLSARGEAPPGGCFENLADVDVDACVAAARDDGDLVWGIAVNLSRLACGKTDPRVVMARALGTAARASKPLLYGLREPEDWPIEEQLSLLRPGDVVTYCFRGNGLGVVSADRHVYPAVWEARRRGVLFDIGHGMASFDFSAAEAALAEGLLPNTISTDQYARHIGLSPPHDLPRTMSKLIACGIPERAAFDAVTSAPAAVLGLAKEVGTLAPGACADLAVLRFNSAAAPLRDVNGVERSGGCWEPVLTVRAGKLIWPNEASGSTATAP